MMLSQLLLPTFSTFNHNAHYDPHIVFRGVYGSNFSSLFDSSTVSSNSYDPLPFSNEVFDLENLETFSSKEIEEICKWINANETEENSCLYLEYIKNSIILPTEEMELDNQLSLLHLFRAYGEAMENGHKELAKVIVMSLNEKSNPMGSTMERVAYNLFKSKEHQSEYLRQESINNFITALKVVYQSLPLGRFAHLTANSAILESMPNDMETLHVIDFDIGEAIQWPPLMEALSQKQKGLKLTSIKYGEENPPLRWEFEETKKRLQCHAKQCGPKFEIEERSTKDLAYEVMGTKKNGQGKEWLVFNCMVGLPHMGRRRARSSVKEFLRIAKELLANFEGILVFGNGEAGVSSDNSSCGFTSFLDQLATKYGAIFESLERDEKTLQP
ncbi:hypothetical protein CDL12_04295 [Handroanthus impetiginosus]|uniref:Uncharacterized protein n=1 Tax=Handroanthus impetiginosus TaxID=429701 RepID=A0A2G9HZP6_9LAMI|nr:hypothetical protein CDL12_04295 [Handroanthus impetiginosus]